MINYRKFEYINHFLLKIERCLVYLVRLAEDDLVVAESKRVAVERHRVQVDVRVGALGLAGARAVKVPDRQFWIWKKDK